MVENSSSVFAAALLARAPARDVAGDNDFYSGLIGSWSVEVFDTEGDLSKRVSNGEWHFARVLEGRGVQDVLIVPAREHRGPRVSTRFNRYGTSLRAFSLADRRWHVYWCNPVDGELYTLTASRAESGVVENGDATHLRWTFSAVKRDSFEARAEKGIANDGEQTWTTIIEIRATRQTAVEQLLADAARAE